MATCNHSGCRCVLFLDDLMGPAAPFMIVLDANQLPCCRICGHALQLHARKSAANSGNTAIRPDIEEILKSALCLTFTMQVAKVSGNAVAISPTFALAALHGKVKVGHAINLRSSSGVLFKAKVVFTQFDKDLVDITVLELEANSRSFPYFTPAAAQPVRLLDDVYVAGLKVSAHDEAMEAAFEGKVSVIENTTGSALFQTQYVSFDSLSGAGVVVKVVGDVFRVIGVHVASHDSTMAPPTIESTSGTSSSSVGKPSAESAATYESTTAALASVCSAIHGHHAWTLICEIARVPALVAFLQDKNLI